MREIKFRAWDSSESKMIYLDDQSMSVEINFLNNWTYNHKTYWEVVTKEGEPGYPHMSQYVDSRRTENKIMQYTGLKDKNGKEIYEGDIVKYIAGKNYQTTGVVTWVDEKNSINFKTYPLICAFVIHNEKENKTDKFEWDETDYMEVIGNIYEGENK